jgi:hypothetical protein
LFEKALVPRLTLRIEHSGYHPTHVTLTRSDKKAKRVYGAAVIEVGPTTKSNWSDELVTEAIALLKVLSGMRTLTIKQRSGIDPAMHARLSKTAKSMDLDTWSIL